MLKEQVAEWLYYPNTKPAKELPKHDQEMIQLGWDAHKAFFKAEVAKLTVLDDGELYQVGLLSEADCLEIERLHKSYGEDIFYGDTDSERHSFAIDMVVGKKRIKAQLQHTKKQLLDLMGE